MSIHPDFLPALVPAPIHPSPGGRRVARRTPMESRPPPAVPWPVRLLCGAVALAAVSVHAASARAAEAVVVASTAPGYATGQVVPDGATVKLPEGAGAMFLFASGRTVRVKGPYEGQLDKMPETARSNIGNLFAGDRFQQADLGATRAFGKPADKTTPTHAIDPGAAGTYCVQSGEQPVLRRPDDPALTRIVLKDTARGTTATVAWAEGAWAPWPQNLPLEDGAEIAVAGADGVTRHALRIRRLEAAPNTAAAAVRLASAGCARQAAAVLTPVRDALVPLDVYLAADRGPLATYRPGEEIRLVLQANRDAHVYCYLRNARSQLIGLFPSSAAGGARVDGAQPLSMPGERMPLPLRAADTAGDMEVRCFAADRDLGPLPGGGTDAFRPMSDAMVADLDRALGGTQGAELVMAQVILRVR